MERDGTLLRLFPIPFRYLEGQQQFKKWQWIKVRVERAKGDNRPESHKVFIDTIDASRAPIPTSNQWQERRNAIAGVPVFADFAELENARAKNGVTLGLVRPTRITSLEITPSERPNWTAEELDKLRKIDLQGSLLADEDEKAFATLKKLPFDFHYRYACQVGAIEVQYRHKIVDWEAGALFWRLWRSKQASWEVDFRAKLEAELPKHDLMFLMGTIHRFPDQWLIVSLIYPPRQPVAVASQGSLFGW